MTIFNKKYDYKQYLTKNMTTIFNDYKKYDYIFIYNI